MRTIDWQRQMRLAGPFQQLVMIALARLGPDTSAASVRRQIESRTGRRVSITAVHTTLQRLGARGYTRSWTRPIFRLRPFDPNEWKHCSSSMVTQAARRFHTLQTLGRRALRLTLHAEDVLRDGLPGLGREWEPYKMLPAWHDWPWSGRPLNRRLRKQIELGLEPEPEAACHPARPSPGDCASPAPPLPPGC